LSGKFWNLSVSQHSGPPWSITRIALPFSLTACYFMTCMTDLIAFISVEDFVYRYTINIYVCMHACGYSFVMLVAKLCKNTRHFTPRGFQINSYISCSNLLMNTELDNIVHYATLMWCLSTWFIPFPLPMKLLHSSAGCSIHKHGALCQPVFLGGRKTISASQPKYVLSKFHFHQKIVACIIISNSFPLYESSCKFQIP
jgi:hypothetical protein